MSKASALCDNVYAGKTYPHLHGTRCMLEPSHANSANWAEAKHEGLAGGVPLRWMDPDQKLRCRSERKAKAKLLLIEGGRP